MQLIRENYVDSVHSYSNAFANVDWNAMFKVVMDIIYGYILWVDYRDRRIILYLYKVKADYKQRSEGM